MHRCRCGAAVVFPALVCVVPGLAPGLLFGVLVGLAPWSAAALTQIGLHLPGMGLLPTAGIAAVLASHSAPRSSYFEATAALAPGADLGIRTDHRACTSLDERRIHPAASCLMLIRSCARSGDPVRAGRSRA